MKKRLIVVLGAGSTHKIKFPTTNQITEIFLNQLKKDDSNEEELSAIKRELELYHKGININYNFEDYFFGLRLLAEKNSKNMMKRKKYIQKIENCINIIKKKILYSIEKYYKNNCDFAWYKNFWEKLSDKYYLDIISLNYDNLFEKYIFKEKIITGFKHYNSELSEFNKELFFKEENSHKLIRLHGCINYTLPFDIDVNRSDKLCNTDYFKNHNIYWQNNDNNILMVNNSSSGDYENPTSAYYKKEEDNKKKKKSKNRLLTTIITGYEKEEFLINGIEPYKSYYQELDKIFDNAKLLLIGYNQNENDRHLNKYIDSFGGRSVNINFDENKIDNNAKVDNNCKYYYNGFNEEFIKYFSEIIDHLN